MKKHFRKTTILLALSLFAVGCSQNNVSNNTQNNNENTTNPTIVKNYTITENGETVDVDVEYKNDIAQKVTQTLKKVPVSKLKQSDKDEYKDVLENGNELRTETQPGQIFIVKKENDTLLEILIYELEKISEKDARHGFNIDDNMSWNEARKKENFEKILKNAGGEEKK